MVHEGREGSADGAASVGAVRMASAA
jgi:hypothetical protein